MYSYKEVRLQPTGEYSVELGNNGIKRGEGHQHYTMPLSVPSKAAILFRETVIKHQLSFLELSRSHLEVLNLSITAVSGLFFFVTEDMEKELGLFM